MNVFIRHELLSKSLLPLSSVFLFFLLLSTPISAQVDSHIRISTSHIKVSFAPNASEADLSVSQQQIIHWITKASQAVATYFDGFPVSELNIVVNSSTRSKVNGTAYSGETPTIILRIGTRTTLKNLQDDWVLVHELVHLAFPPMQSKHNWIEEGVATYIEPMIRVKAGLMSQEDAWKWLITGTPKGLPEYGDKGLDNTHTWGRTYWGGALYFLLADYQIRQQSHDKFSIQDALRAIKKSGGTMQQDSKWPITKALLIGDKATGTKVMINLYNQMKNKAVMTDLDALWKRLGVSLRNNSVVFNNNAPESKLRMSMVSRQ